MMTTPILTLLQMKKSSGRAPISAASMVRNTSLLSFTTPLSARHIGDPGVTRSSRLPPPHLPYTPHRYYDAVNAYLLQQYSPSPAAPQQHTSEKLASALLKMFSYFTAEYLPCDEGWLKLGASWYFLSVHTSTWHESRRKCIALDSDLVKVTTDEEYNFLRNLVKGHNTWVGLTDLQVEGIHAWTDGTVHPMIKSWWGDSEPNTSEEKCIHYYSSKDDRWNDRRCDS
ncbi:perlucin-like protein [Palaemon carinicauda]|uniref:perlucin-like protein n=1 Tax=Palaemon carinicauda TaxID=392227 RepID=UPI0035B590C9